MIEAPTLAPDAPQPRAANLKPSPGSEIGPKLASSGESTPTTQATPPPAPIVTPGSSTQGIRLEHTVEPAPHFPTIRR